jgi:hypothetical protein
MLSALMAAAVCSAADKAYTLTDEGLKKYDSGPNKSSFAPVDSDDDAQPQTYEEPYPERSPTGKGNNAVDKEALVKKKCGRAPTMNAKYIDSFIRKNEKYLKCRNKIMFSND